MDPVETLFVISQMRHRELIKEAERERLFKLALNNQPDNQSLGLKIIEWLRAQFPENGHREERPLEQHHTSNPCCTVTVSESE